MRKFLLGCVVLSGFLPRAWTFVFTVRQSDAEYQPCVDDLYTADNGDLELTSEEYLSFIGLRSDGRLEFSEYASLPLSLVTTFNFAACLCFLISSDSQCCVGEDAHINLDPSVSEFVQQSILTFCVQVDNAVKAELTPTPAPTAGKTREPTVAPTTVAPTFPPSFLRSPSPSIAPSATLTTSPTAAPTATPTNAPTSFPTLVPSVSPTSTPTLAPVPISPTPRPTNVGEICINFQYGIVNNAGFDADAIFNMVDNTLKTGLILAAENVTIEILNTTFPEDRALEAPRPTRSVPPPSAGPHKTAPDMESQRLVVPLEYFDSDLPDEIVSSISTPSSQGDSRRLAYLSQKWNAVDDEVSRRLVYYTDASPPDISAIMDNPICPSQTPGLTQCAIVSSTVCVQLEEGDDEDIVLTELRSGIRRSISSGEFEQAIPPENQLP